MLYLTPFLILIIAAMAIIREDGITRGWEKWLEARENYEKPPPQYPKWRFLCDFATPERQGKTMFFYYDAAKIQGFTQEKFLPRRFVSIPSYFYEPRAVIVNDFSQIDSADLIYTEHPCFESLDAKLKAMGKMQDFNIVLLYGAYQLLERKQTPATRKKKPWF